MVNPTKLRHRRRAGKSGHLADLRGRLVDMRVKLIERLVKRIDGGDLALYGSVGAALAALDRFEAEHRQVSMADTSRTHGRSA
jgi:hypothetical protein